MEEVIFGALSSHCLHVTTSLRRQEDSIDRSNESAAAGCPACVLNDRAG